MDTVYKYLLCAVLIFREACFPAFPKSQCGKIWTERDI
jgi:hypothetical protein